VFVFLLRWLSLFVTGWCAVSGGGGMVVPQNVVSMRLLGWQGGVEHPEFPHKLCVSSCPACLDIEKKVCVSE
jgi:hypothetical protein